MKFLSLIILMLGFGLAANAANTDACTPIRHACTAAGYKYAKKSDSKAAIQALRNQGIDLSYDCLRLVLQGKASSVPRLKADSSWNIAQCKAVRASQVSSLNIKK